MAEQSLQAASEGGCPSGNKPSLGSRLCAWIGSGVLVVAALLCAVLVLPRLFGVMPYVIVTGSMEPAIPVGSAVYVTSADGSQLQPGDVIAYRASEGSLEGNVIVHRVVSNDAAARTLITQGDANSAVDPLPVSYGNVLGQVVFSVPVLGYVSTALSSWIGKLCALCVILGGIGLCLVSERLQKRQAD